MPSIGIRRASPTAAPYTHTPPPSTVPCEVDGGGPGGLLTKATSYKTGKHVPVEGGVLAPQPRQATRVFRGKCGCHFCQESSPGRGGVGRCWGSARPPAVMKIDQSVLQRRGPRALAV